MTKQNHSSRHRALQPSAAQLSNAFEVRGAVHLRIGVLFQDR